VGLVVLIGLFHGLTKTSGGEVAVVRNGGPFDNHRTRQVIDPASAITWTGWWSQVHKYPAQQRFYTITANGGGDRPGVDVVHTPTSDGVNVGIEGTIYFQLTLDHAALRKFDDKFGTRKFRGLDGVIRAAYDGDDGWSGFLDQIVRPVIDNNLREQINAFRCAELVSSCALVQNATSRRAGLNGARSNNGNIAKVQDAINSSLAKDLTQTLGGQFFTNIRFNLVRITLPPKVQAAVDDAQAAFAQVTQAQARVESARADAQANAIRERGYKDCPACAQIDELKAIPPSVQTFAPGAGFSVTPGR
jgi:regulator of protease activity HflC (stomatin/prohibitin superfamily)